MICPRCSEGRAEILDSRERMDFVYRSRKCNKCGYKFATREYFHHVIEDNARKQVKFKRQLVSKL